MAFASYNQPNYYALIIIGYCIHVNSKTLIFCTFFDTKAGTIIIKGRHSKDFELLCLWFENILTNIF